MSRSLLIFLALMVWVVGPVRAAGKGDIQLAAGLIYASPQESSQPLQTDLRPSLLSPVLDESFTSPGTSAGVSSSATLIVTGKYFFTDHVAVQVEGGIPAEFDLRGEGEVQPPGLGGAIGSVDLGAPQNNPLASARQWSPVLMAQYVFREPSAVFRPYIGLGVTYTWFTDVDLNDHFKDRLNNQFGSTLALIAGKPGPTSVEADTSSDTAPVYSLGANYALDERWGLSLSVSYLPLETTSTIKIKAEDGTTLATSRTTTELNPVVFAALLSYRF